MGEWTWQSHQHRLLLGLTPTPSLLLIDHGPPQQLGPGSGLLSFYPAGSAYRTADNSSRYAHVCWSTDLYGTIAPDLARLPQVEPALTVSDPLLGQLLRSLVEEIGENRVDLLLADSLSRRSPCASPSASTHCRAAGRTCRRGA